MKLPEFFGIAQRKISEGAAWIKHPAQLLWQQGENVVRRIFDNIEVPGGHSPIAEEKRSATATLAENPAQSSEVRTKHGVGATLAVSAKQPAQPNQIQQRLPEAGWGDRPFILSEGAKLVGKRWGSYTIEKCLQTGERCRIYTGKNSNDELVHIKEYLLLERDFDPTQIQERQNAFKQLIDLNFKIGQGPDFRLVKLVDAFVNSAEHRCYLVTKPIHNSISLEEYLVRQGAMTAAQVREVLRQVLETLWFLHDAYRVCFSVDGSEKGLPHGYLNLNSLVIRSMDSSHVVDERQFFVHVTDLALWEHLFYPPDSSLFKPVAKSAKDLGSVRQDLKNLGWIAFYLLGGKARRFSELASEFESVQLWDRVQDPPLKYFIQRLLELETAHQSVGTALPSAEVALQALHHPSEPPPPGYISTQPTEEDDDREKQWAWYLLLLLPFMGFCGLLGYYFMTGGWLTKRSLPGELASSPIPEDICCIKTSTPLTYLVEAGGTWKSAIEQTFVEASGTQTNLTAKLRESLIRPRFTEPRRTTSLGLSRTEIFDRLKSGSADVALMRLADDVKQSGLQEKVVAHDALVVFVAFSDVYGQKSAPKRIGDSITKEELYQIYTGKTKTLNGQRIKLFFPEEKETIEVFKSLIMKDDDPAQADFESALEKSRAYEKKEDKDGNKVRDDIYAQIQLQSAESENDEIGIGFDRLSRVYGQCSVYPLAMTNAQRQTIQTLVTTDAKPIDPSTDLCSKGSYRVNVEALKSGYPLAYPLGIVFSQESQTAGTTFAELLNTLEGQYLMSQVGLFPQRPLSEIWKGLYGSKQP